jgi:hypothetical protein
MLQIIFDLISELLEGAWRVHRKRFEKKFEDGPREISRA